MIARQEKGVSGGGLMTAVQPAARAAPSLRAIIREGKFHGVIIALFYHEDRGVMYKKCSYTTPK
jgi:hypothetical protein